MEPVDALRIVNDLGRNGSRTLGLWNSGQPFLDVNGDGGVTPIDALGIINQLSRQSFIGSGEFSPAAVKQSELSEKIVPLDDQALFARSAPDSAAQEFSGDRDFTGYRYIDDNDLEILASDHHEEFGPIQVRMLEQIR